MSAFTYDGWGWRYLSLITVLRTVILKQGI
jgi:hypothetical protein